MRPGVVRRGPGLVGTMARTTVIAGTATAVSEAVVDPQQGEQQQATAERPALDQQQETAAIQANQAEAGRSPTATAPATAAPAAAPAAPAASANDLTTQLKQLADLKAAGALSDAEFKAAKAKLLGG
jgi:Short C-terminal domain